MRFRESNNFAPNIIVRKEILEYDVVKAQKHDSLQHRASHYVGHLYRESGHADRIFC
jgi:hypothetical protein